MIMEIKRMSLTILEVLENAEYNLKNGINPMSKDLAIEQLSNAIAQLEEDSDANAEYRYQND